MKFSQKPHRTSGAPCQDIEQACFELSELAMPIFDQSCTSSSSLAIAALMSVSGKAPARSRVLQHSKASMALGFCKTLLSEMVCLAPANNRSGSEDILGIEWTLIAILISRGDFSRCSFHHDRIFPGLLIRGPRRYCSSSSTGAMAGVAFIIQRLYSGTSEISLVVVDCKAALASLS